MKKTLQLTCLMIASLSLSVGLFACGNSATSTATDITPLSILNATTTPQLSGILSTNTYGSGFVSGFTVNNPYWIFNATSFNGNYIAPAAGLVTDIGVAQLNGTSVTYVTIVHSGHLASRVYGMQVTQVRSNDIVLQGSIIGSYLNSGSVGFQVLWDNTPVCPLSYMTSAFRTQLSATGFFAQLCN